MLQIVYFIFYPLFTVKRVPPLLTSQWISLTIQGDGLEAHPVGITSRAEKSSTYYILHLQSSTRLCTDTANFMGPGQWEGNSDSETSDSKDKVSSYRYSQVLPSARLSATSSGRSNKTTRSTPLLGAVAWKGKKYISIEKKTHIINWNMNAIRKCRLLKGSLSINALRACVYINIQQLGSFGRPRGLSIWLLLLAIFNTLFWVYVNFFQEKTDKTRKYSKSAIFVWHENGRRRLLGAQSIDTEIASLNSTTIDCCYMKEHVNIKSTST